MPALVTSLAFSIASITSVSEIIKQLLSTGILKPEPPAGHQKECRFMALAHWLHFTHKPKTFELWKIMTADLQEYPSENEPQIENISFLFICSIQYALFNGNK